MSDRVVLVVAVLAALSCAESLSAAEPEPVVRQAIELTAPERDYLIAEMHANLAAFESLFGALARDDSRTAEAAASTRGTAGYRSRDSIRPKMLAAKLPPAFKAMSAALRESFDQLAAGIAARETAAQSLDRVSHLTAICNSCHASFRFATAP